MSQVDLDCTPGTAAVRGRTTISKAALTVGQVDKVVPMRAVVEPRFVEAAGNRG